MGEFQNRKFHKGGEVIHLLKHKLSLSSRSPSKTIERFFPQRHLGTTQILNLILEEEKNPAKVGGKSHFCNFFWSKKTGVFPVHFWCIFSPLRGICNHFGSGTWFSLSWYCKKRRSTRPSIHGCTIMAIPQLN